MTAPTPEQMKEAVPRLSGNEKWVIDGLSGETIWARKYGDKDFWLPVYDIELDCGLIRVDVCGLLEVWDLRDCAQLRIGVDRFVEPEGILPDSYQDASIAAAAQAAKGEANS